MAIQNENYLKLDLNHRSVADIFYSSPFIFIEFLSDNRHTKGGDFYIGFVTNPSLELRVRRQLTPYILEAANSHADNLLLETTPFIIFEY